MLLFIPLADFEISKSAVSEFISVFFFRRRMCSCSEAGSLYNNPECLPDTGICQCKEYVDGINCDRFVFTHVLQYLRLGNFC